MTANLAPVMIPVAGSASIRPAIATDSIMIGEKAAAVDDIASFGQLWVKTGTPNQLFFTNDEGTDTQLGVSGIAIDSTVITGGTPTRILFENASNQVSQSASLQWGETNIGLHITSTGTSVVAQQVEGFAGTSVDLSQWFPSGGTPGDFARVTKDGEFSNTKTGLNSAYFGEGAGPVCTANSVVIIGALAAPVMTTHPDSTIVGRSAAINLVAGFGANCMFGQSSGGGLNSGWGNSHFGQGTRTNNGSDTFGIAIGIGSVTDTSHFVAGSDTGPINDVYFGKGIDNATPGSYAIRGTGAIGTDIAGGEITLGTGVGTGLGLPGSVFIKSAPGDAGTGGTPNDLSETVIEVSANATVGTLGFYAATPVAQQTGVAVTDAAIHAALVNLGLITA